MSDFIHVGDEMKLVEITEFDCPNCGMPHDKEDYENELNDKGVAIIECSNCDVDLRVEVKNKVSVREIKD